MGFAKNYRKPSLVGVAVFAFDADGHNIPEDMKRDGQRHQITSLPGGVSETACRCWEQVTPDSDFSKMRLDCQLLSVYRMKIGFCLPFLK